MSLRSSTIYVEPKTVRRLLLVAKMYPERVADLTGMATREKTADERADVLINEAIRQKYPKVVELERVLAQTEKDFLEGVKTKERKQQNEKDNTDSNSGTDSGERGIPMAHG